MVTPYGTFLMVQLPENQHIFKTLNPSTGPLVLGNNPEDGTFFNGSLDEVRIYSRSVSPDEVNSLFIYRDTVSSYSPPKIYLHITALLEAFYDPVADIMVPDTVGLYLHAPTAPYNKIDSVKTYLNENGQALCSFNNAQSGNYYLAIHHRNHLETWSSLPRSFSSGDTLDLDFSADSSTTYNGNLIKHGNRWTIFAGDVNQDGWIDLTDCVLIDDASYNFDEGYMPADINGDGYADFTDLTVCDNNIYNTVGLASPTSGLRVKPVYKGVLQLKTCFLNQSRHLQIKKAVGR